MINILCYGDSNTHGTMPMAHARNVRRFGPQQRWPGIMQAKLGSRYHVIEEGLPGRTSMFDDPIEGAHKNGRAYLQPCLESHWPLDFVVLMLGVNDLKARFGLSAHDIACAAGAMVAATQALTAAAGQPARILLVAPPPMACIAWAGPMYQGGPQKALELAALFEAQADLHGAGFFDAGKVAKVCSLDGIHFDEASHRALGLAVAAQIAA